MRRTKINKLSWISWISSNITGHLPCLHDEDTNIQSGWSIHKLYMLKWLCICIFSHWSLPHQQFKTRETGMWKTEPIVVIHNMRRVLSKARMPKTFTAKSLVITGNFHQDGGAMGKALANEHFGNPICSFMHSHSPSSERWHSSSRHQRRHFCASLAERKNTEVSPWSGRPWTICQFHD